MGRADMQWQTRRGKTDGTVVSIWNVLQLSHKGLHPSLKAPKAVKHALDGRSVCFWPNRLEGLACTTVAHQRTRIVIGVDEDRALTSQSDCPTSPLVPFERCSVVSANT
jgi:hypothetical protein